MKHFDEFSLNLEQVSPMEKHIRKVIRNWADNDCIPFRRQYDEDWKEHKIIEPAFQKLMVDLGFQKAMFPEELGGWGIGHSDYVFRIAYALSEEVGRADTAIAVAFLVTIWPLTTILVEPHVNWRLAREFAPWYVNAKHPVFSALVMTEPQGGADIENMGLLGGKTLRTTARLDGDEWVINGH